PLPPAHPTPPAKTGSSGSGSGGSGSRASGSGSTGSSGSGASAAGSSGSATSGSSSTAVVPATSVSRLPALIGPAAGTLTSSAFAAKDLDTLPDTKHNSFMISINADTPVLLH